MLGKGGEARWGLGPGEKMQCGKGRLTAETGRLPCADLGPRSQKPRGEGKGGSRHCSKENSAFL